jgi:tRNA modification GTPase
VSAKNGLHLETLKERMVDVVLQGQVQTESTIVTNAGIFMPCSNCIHPWLMFKKD